VAIPRIPVANGVVLKFELQKLLWEHGFQFFCSRPQISTKTGSLRFGNKLNKEKGLVKSLVIRTREKPEGRKYLPGFS
jgi:hypothetical protein